jgi:hypothetical protein
MVRALRLLLVPLASGIACGSDGENVLRDACDVIVNDCGVGDSVGACLDAVGDQLDECLACIAETGCDYATRCDEDARCDLPASYRSGTAP